MNLFLKKGLVFALFFLLCACSLASDYEAQRKMAQAVRNEDFDTAVQIASSDEFFSGDASRMVKYTDLGTAHYLKGDYYQALLNFDKAQALGKEQYTKSVSRAIAGFVGGDAMTDYPTPLYELSLLRFYTSLTHLRLSEKGVYESYVVDDEKAPDGKRVVEEKTLDESEKRRHFTAARANILDWDSLLSSYSAELAGKDTFKQDMLAKTWGAYIHDRYGSSGDRQITKLLYRDVDKVLLRHYNAYPVYNARAEKYADAYKKLPDMPETQVKAEYVSATKRAKELSAFAKESENALFAPSKSRPNVQVLMKTGLVSERKEEVVSFTVPWEILLLGHWDDKGFKEFIKLALAGEKIEFKYLYLDKPQTPDGYEIVFEKKSGKAKKIKKNAVLVEPVSQIVYHEYMTHRAAGIAKKGAWAGAKYAAALWAAYALWDDDDAFSQLAAIAAFKVSAASIRASDSVDLRAWSLLPDNIWQQSFSLPSGSYIMTILRNNAPVYTREVDIKGENVVFLDIDLVKE